MPAKSTEKEGTGERAPPARRREREGRERASGAEKRVGKWQKLQNTKTKRNQDYKCLVSSSYLKKKKELKKRKRRLERNQTLDHINGAPDVDY